MLINIETYKIIKEVDISQINIDVLSIDFLNKSAMFKVFFLNNEFPNNDSIKYVQIEGSEYEYWGNDDNYIFDLILNKLGLVKKNNI